MLAGAQPHASLALACAGADRLPAAALGHVLQEAAHDAQIDVRLEERQAHLAQRLFDVRVVELRRPAQTVARRAEAPGQGLEHGRGEASKARAVFAPALRESCPVCEPAARPSAEGYGGLPGMATEVEAHITGTVFRIDTSVGSEVAIGEELVILEAMKREMPGEAPAPGRVSEIRGEEGQSGEEGDVLVVLE